MCNAPFASRVSPRITPCGLVGSWLGLLAILTFTELAAAGTSGEDNRAAKIVAATGVQGGLIVHLGCGDGRLTAALHRGDSYLVQGLDTEADNVDQAREHIQSLGVYGPVSVDRFDGRRLPYTDNLVNLLVAEEPGEVAAAEMMRVLAPNGVAYVRENGGWAKRVKPRPGEIDEWTHYLHDASGNAVAKDSIVGPPRRYQWIAGPRWARSHDHLSSLSALVSSRGRVFYIVDEGPIASVAIDPKWRLVARDAFSGVVLWKRSIDPWEGHLRDFRSGPTELARRLVAIGDRVYVTLGYGKPVSELDAATGETIKTYGQTDGAMEIICHDGTLFVVAGDRPPDNTGGAAKPVNPTDIWHWWPIYEDKPPKKRLVAIRADTGEVLWTKADEETAELMPTTLSASARRVFLQNQKELLAMDTASGSVLWRAVRAVNPHRPTWSAPTVVVHGDVVLCGDRDVQAPPPDKTEATKDSRWVVSSTGGQAPVGQIIAFSAATGERLWESACKECYNSPVDVLVADDLVWSGNLVRSKDPGITSALDVHTGEVKRTRVADQKFFRIVMSHHRCYRNKATEKYLVLGRDGIEYIDLASGEGFGNAWVRGSCQYGVMPANGLTYAPHHSCACHVESKLNSFNALAAGGSPAKPLTDAARLARGPAYEGASGRDVKAESKEDWPTYRHDAARRGRASSEVPADLKEEWKVKLPGGRPSSPVIASGMVFVACADTHMVCALNAEDGKLVWSFTAGGRVDSPPTIHQGWAIFGSADGRIYCLDAADGRLAWSFLAALEDRRIVAYGQVESAWPVHGSVLVLDGVIQAVAGRTSYLDGGMVLWRLDAETGQKLSQTPITAPALPDVLSCDGSSVYLRHRRFDTEGAEQKTPVPHLYSPAGFLDDTWWHRTYWMFGTTMRSGWGAWPNSGNLVPAGRLMVVDDGKAYGFGRFNQYHRNGSHVGLGQMRYTLYASPLKASGSATGKSGQAARRGGKPAAPQPVASLWTESIPVLARGMVLSGDALFVAGPPDVFAPASKETADPYHIESAKALEEQGAALEGKRGGMLLSVSAESGQQLAKYDLEAPPAWDGLAVARGRLFVSLGDGSVLCMGGR